MPAHHLDSHVAGKPGIDFGTLFNDAQQLGRNLAETLPLSAGYSTRSRRNERWCSIVLGRRCDYHADPRSAVKSRQHAKNQFREDRMGRFFRAVVAVLVLGVSALTMRPALAAGPDADFFRGKTMRILVGASESGGYDLVARAIASRLKVYIPGNPGIVVENRPGASGLAMVNYLYNSAPRDGTVIGLPTNATAFEPRLHVLTRAGGSAAFDVSRFSWLGTAARLPQVLFVWHTAGVETALELKTMKVVLGALAAGSDSSILPTVINNVLPGKIDIVGGYQGQTDAYLAVERGEVQGHSGSFAGLIANKADWVRDKLVRILIQFGSERIPQLPDVPTAIELASNPLDKAMLRFYSLKYEIAYALIAPPNVPVERVQLLRQAFDRTMQDPDYIAAAKSIGVPVNPLDGDAVTKIIDTIQATPQEVVDRMLEMMVAKSTK
jgi:tripartite-type tricarboxylate transporter receptor subunit TctC